MRKMQNPTSKKPMLKRAILICGILASMLTVGYSAISDDERARARHNCFDNDDKSACQSLIDIGLPSAEQCNKDTTCFILGVVYVKAGHYREAIPYFKKAITLKDNGALYNNLGVAYQHLNDYFSAKKYFEIGCNKVSDAQSLSCYNLGVMYYNGEGVRQDYHKAAELYKKACDMKDAMACNNLGAIYGKGLGVKQNRSIAKQYYGKACDLGEQLGCDNYKNYNKAGL